MRLKCFSKCFCVVQLLFLVLDFVTCDEIVINLHASPPSISAQSKPNQYSTKERPGNPQRQRHRQQSSTRPGLGQSPAFSHDYVETAESHPIEDSEINRGDTYLPEEAQLEQEYHYYGDDPDTNPLPQSSHQHQQKTRVYSSEIESRQSSAEVSETNIYEQTPYQQSEQSPYQQAKQSPYQQSDDESQAYFGEETQSEEYVNENAGYPAAVHDDEYESPAADHDPGIYGHGPPSGPIPVPFAVGQHQITHPPVMYQQYRPPNYGVGANLFKNVQLGEFALLFIPAALLTLVYIFYVAANSPNNAHSKYYVDHGVGYPGGVNMIGMGSKKQPMIMTMNKNSMSMSSKPMMQSQHHMSQMPSNQQQQQQQTSDDPQKEMPPELLQMMQNMSPSMMEYLSRSSWKTLLKQDEDDNDDDKSVEDSEEKRSTKAKSSKLSKVVMKRVKVKNTAKSAKDITAPVGDLLFPSNSTQVIKVEEEVSS